MDDTPVKFEDDGCLCSIVINQRKYYISTTWTDEDFSVALTDGLNVWRGEGIFHMGPFRNANLLTLMFSCAAKAACISYSIDFLKIVKFCPRTFIS